MHEIHRRREKSAGPRDEVRNRADRAEAAQNRLAVKNTASLVDCLPGLLVPAHEHFGTWWRL